MLARQEITIFEEALWGHYAQSARTFLPWRAPEPDGSFDPYKILVSEIMLQQTQAARVAPKYEMFVATFPDVHSLASAELGSVLGLWQGLGYNRRAKYLWEAAKIIAAKGWPKDLTTLPGVGANTAGAVCAYAFNEPVIFIETNIRTVLIHHFGGNQQAITDKWIRDILAEIVATVLPQEKEQPARKSHFSPGAMRKNQMVLSHYRDFYWAMMDYGVHLKATEGNISRRSKHYKKQSAFIGSNREVRGKVIKQLLKGAKSRASLVEIIDDNRLDIVLSALEQEGLVTLSGGVYHISNGQ